MGRLLDSEYTPIKATTDDAALIDTENESLLPAQLQRPQTHLLRRDLIITIVNILIFSISLVCFSLSVGYYHNFRVLNPDLRRTSSWSPIHDMLDLQPHIKTINGTLFPPKEVSIARQPPNHEADEIWWEYELLRVIPVSKETVIKLGKDPATAVKLEDEIWGLGEDAYGAVFDVYHQLHCLNSLRKIAYGGYYNASQGRADTLKLREMHINHCADIIFQAIQCSGNVNLMTLHWVETQDNPWPDMSINRQCINFDRLTEFRKEVSLNMDKYKRVMAKPKGVTQLPAPDQYYELYGGDNPNHLHGQDQDNDHIL